MSPSPLHDACYDDDEDEVAELLRHNGVDVNEPIKPKHSLQCGWSSGESPLHIASAHASLEIMELLFEYHAAVNQKAHDGSTPLYSACEAGRSDDDAILLLINHGADVNHARTDGQTALYIASWCGFWDVCTILLDRGASVDQPTNIGWTPLAAACYQGHLKPVQILVEKGLAQIDRPTGTGATCLYLACQRGHEHIVKYLVEAKGAETDVHWKARYYYDPVLQASIQEQASGGKVDGSGRIDFHEAYKARLYGPLEVARENNYLSIVSFLEDQQSLRDKEVEASVTLSREKLTLLVQHPVYAFQMEPPELSIHYIQRHCSFDVTVGGGAFGQVFLGKDDQLQLQYAIKRITVDRRNSEEGAQVFARIRKEILALNTFRHANMVPLFGYCSHEFSQSDEIHHYLLYEYYPHGSLDRFLRDDN